MPISDLRRAAIRIVQNRFLCSSYMIKSFGFVYFVTKNCLWKPNRDIANKVRLMRERFFESKCPLLHAESRDRTYPDTYSCMIQLIMV